MKAKYYLTGSGRSPIEGFLELCSEDIRSDFVDAVALLEQGKALSMPLNRSLSSIFPGLNELRFKDRSGQYRFLYYIKKRDGIYFLHAFKKKTQELPQKEKEIVLKRLKEI